MLPNTSRVTLGVVVPLGDQRRDAGHGHHRRARMHPDPDDQLERPHLHGGRSYSGRRRSRSKSITSPPWQACKPKRHRLAHRRRRGPAVAGRHPGGVHRLDHRPRRERLPADDLARRRRRLDIRPTPFTAGDPLGHAPPVVARRPPAGVRLPQRRSDEPGAAIRPRRWPPAARSAPCASGTTPSTPWSGRRTARPSPSVPAPPIRTEAQRRRRTSRPAGSPACSSRIDNVGWLARAAPPAPRGRSRRHGQAAPRSPKATTRPAGCPGCPDGGGLVVHLRPPRQLGPGPAERSLDRRRPGRGRPGPRRPAPAVTEHRAPLGLGRRRPGRQTGGDDLVRVAGRAPLRSGWRSSTSTTGDVPVVDREARPHLSPLHGPAGPRLGRRRPPVPRRRPRQPAPVPGACRWPAARPNRSSPATGGCTPSTSIRRDRSRRWCRPRPAQPEVVVFDSAERGAGRSPRSAGAFASRIADLGAGRASPPPPPMAPRSRVGTSHRSAPGRRAAPDPAQRPRRAVHAVRQQVLRRVPDAGGRRLRRRLLQPRAGRRGTATPGARPWPGRRTRCIRAPGWGTVDADDVIAVLDEAVRRFDTIDPDRLGVLGGSYGGYMTTWLLGHDDRFKAGCSERAANDLIALERVVRHRLGLQLLHQPSVLRRSAAAGHQLTPHLCG